MGSNDFSDIGWTEIKQQSDLRLRQIRPAVNVDDVSIADRYGEIFGIKRHHHIVDSPIALHDRAKIAGNFTINKTSKPDDKKCVTLSDIKQGQC
jgi:hypothetical protein